MPPLYILFIFIFILFCAFLGSQVIRFFRLARASSHGAVAKDITVVSYKNPAGNAAAGFPTEIPDRRRMDRELMDATLLRQGTADSMQPRQTDRERRTYPRTAFQCYVEFIKEGRLFKETSRDLSFSGIYLKTQSPEKYRKNDLILLSFQTPDGNPQKRSGRIVRKKSDGFGVHFIPEPRGD